MTRMKRALVTGSRGLIGSEAVIFLDRLGLVEAIERVQDLLSRSLYIEYVETSRVGDHITYISDLRKWRAEYPEWRVTRSLDDIFRELVGH